MRVLHEGGPIGDNAALRPPLRLFRRSFAARLQTTWANTMLDLSNLQIGLLIASLLFTGVVAGILRT